MRYHLNQITTLQFHGTGSGAIHFSRRSCSDNSELRLQELRAADAGKDKLPALDCIGPELRHPAPTAGHCYRMKTLRGPSPSASVFSVSAFVRLNLTANALSKRQ